MWAISDARSKPSTPAVIVSTWISASASSPSAVSTSLIRARVWAATASRRPSRHRLRQRAASSWGWSGVRATSVAPAASASATAVGGIDGTIARIGISASAGKSRASDTSCAVSLPTMISSAGRPVATGR